MNMINKVHLTGNLGHDPDTSMTQDGREMVTLSVATNSSWKNEKGEWQNHVAWHRIVIFRKEAIQRIKGSLKKGDSVVVEGKLSYVKLEDKRGQRRKLACVVVCDRQGKILLLQSREDREKYEDAVENEPRTLPSLIDNHNISNLRNIAFLKKAPFQSKFKERPPSTVQLPQETIDSDLTQLTGNSSVSHKKPSTHQNPSLTTGDNPYENN